MLPAPFPQKPSFPLSRTPLIYSSIHPLIHSLRTPLTTKIPHQKQKVNIFTPSGLCLGYLSLAPILPTYKVAISPGVYPVSPNPQPCAEPSPSTHLLVPARREFIGPPPSILLSPFFILHAPSPKTSFQTARYKYIRIRLYTLIPSAASFFVP